MKKLIRADIRRVPRKRSFVLIVIFLPLLQVGEIYSIAADYPAELFEKMQRSLEGLCLLLVTISIYLAVFADDQRAGAITTVIGSGMSRRRLLVAKLVDCAILSVIMYALKVAFKYFLFWLFNASLSPWQKGLLLVFAGLVVVRGTGCLAISMLVQFATGSTAMAIITDLVLVMFMKNLLQLLQSLYHIGIYDYSFSGLLDAASALAAAVKGMTYRYSPIALLGTKEDNGSSYCMLCSREDSKGARVYSVVFVNGESDGNTELKDEFVFAPQGVSLSNRHYGGKQV